MKSMNLYETRKKRLPNYLLDNSLFFTNSLITFRNFYYEKYVFGTLCLKFDLFIIQRLSFWYVRN